MNQGKRLAILVGGGPAPGINSVISAATIRSVLEGVEVIGVRQGFQWLMKGDITHTVPLTIEEVSRIHFNGGSHLGTARANPTKNPEDLERVVDSLLRLGVSLLITIGGDDTAWSAMNVERVAAGRIKVVHVPKTIDNDLDLPAPVDTFGFQTARSIGVQLVKNLMTDARTTSRWYFVISMGRKAGHLALGIGKAAGATLTLIPEEFAGGYVRLKTLVDTLACGIIKRLAHGRPDGVAVIAEGVMDSLHPDDASAVEGASLDEHGHIRLAEVPIGAILRKKVLARLTELGVKTSIVEKDIGYELRCADPIPMDMEYTRDLGYCAAKYILGDGNAAMVSVQGGEFVPIPFAQMVDPKTGRTAVRMVNIRSPRYAIARRYMIRLRRDDFEDRDEITRMATVAGLTPQRFTEEFEYLTQNEAPALVLEQPKA